MQEKHIPERTCVCCRKKLEKNSMLRVVKTADGFYIDETGKKNGRGAYICKDEACAKKLVKSRGLDKSFKTAVPIEFYQEILEYLKNN